MISNLDYLINHEHYRDLTRDAKAARAARLARMEQDRMSRTLRFLLSISNTLIRAGTKLHTYALNQLPGTLQPNS